MLSYIWSGMIIISILVSCFTGRLDAVTQEALKSASFAVEMCIKLLGVMMLWTGLMNIAEKSGLINILGKIISPITKLLFPDVAPKSKAMNAIVLNLVANVLGLSNAATPLGLCAMKELSKLSNYSKTASNAMCMFVVINNASIQLIPSTIIAIRTAFLSKNPFEIIFPIWVSSIIGTIVGIIFTKIFEKTGKKLVIK